MTPAGLGLGSLPALSPGVHPGRPSAPHPRSPLPRKYGKYGAAEPSPNLAHTAPAALGGGGRGRPQSAAPAITADVFHSFNGMGVALGTPQLEAPRGPRSPQLVAS